MKLTVSGTISDSLLRGINNFAEDMGADVTHVDRHQEPFVVTVS